MAKSYSFWEIRFPAVRGTSAASRIFGVAGNRNTMPLGVQESHRRAGCMSPISEPLTQRTVRPPVVVIVPPPRRKLLRLRQGLKLFRVQQLVATNILEPGVDSPAAQRRTTSKAEIFAVVDRSEVEISEAIRECAVARLSHTDPAPCIHEYAAKLSNNLWSQGELLVLAKIRTAGEPSSASGPAKQPGLGKDQPCRLQIGSFI
jgi:hypothetical protein